VLLLVAVEFTIEPVHLPDVNENEDDKDVDHSLLGKPEHSSAARYCRFSRQYFR
jgi:hypothetical protein